MIVSAASSLEIDPLGAINVYAFLAGSLMISVLFWSVAHSFDHHTRGVKLRPGIPTK